MRDRQVVVIDQGLIGLRGLSIFDSLSTFEKAMEPLRELANKIASFCLEASEYRLQRLVTWEYFQSLFEWTWEEQTPQRGARALPSPLRVLKTSESTGGFL